MSGEQREADKDNTEYARTPEKSFFQALYQAIQEKYDMHGHSEDEVFAYFSYVFFHEPDDNQKIIFLDILNRTSGILSSFRQSNADLLDASLLFIGQKHDYRPDLENTLEILGNIKNKSLHLVLERRGDIYYFLPIGKFVAFLKNLGFSSIIKEADLCTTKGEFLRSIRSKIVALYIANLLAEGRNKDIAIIFGDEHLDEMVGFLNEFLRDMGYDDNAIAQLRIQRFRTLDPSPPASEQETSTTGEMPESPDIPAETATVEAVPDTVKAHVIADVKSHIENIINLYHGCDDVEKNIISRIILEDKNLIKIMIANSRYIFYASSPLHKLMERELHVYVPKILDMLENNQHSHDNFSDDHEEKRSRKEKFTRYPSQKLLVPDDGYTTSSSQSSSSLRSSASDIFSAPKGIDQSLSDTSLVEQDERNFINQIEFLSMEEHRYPLSAFLQAVVSDDPEIQAAGFAGILQATSQLASFTAEQRTQLLSCLLLNAMHNTTATAALWQCAAQIDLFPFEDRNRLLNTLLPTDSEWGLHLLPNQLIKALANNIKEVRYEEEHNGIISVFNMDCPELVVDFYSYEDPLLHKYLQDTLGINLWSYNHDGMTAFHIAASTGNATALHQLLFNEPNGVLATNAAGKMPHELAAAMQYPEIMKILEKAYEDAMHQISSPEEVKRDPCPVKEEVSSMALGEQELVASSSRFFYNPMEIQSSVASIPTKDNLTTQPKSTTPKK